MDEAERMAEQEIQALPFRELDEPKRNLLARIHQVDCGCPLVQFMLERPRELLTADDIAFHLQQSSSCIEATLRQLIELGLARRQEVTGIAFFGLGHESGWGRLAQELCAWQRRWQSRLTRLQKLLTGEARV